MDNTTVDAREMGAVDGAAIVENADADFYGEQIL